MASTSLHTVPSENPSTPSLVALRSPVRIRVEPSAYDPHMCKFVVQQHGKSDGDGDNTTAAIPLYAGAPLYFADQAQATDAPLARRLFSVVGVAQVLIDGNVITLTKTDVATWVDIAKPVGEALRAHLHSGDPVAVVKELPPVALDAAVRAVIADDVNPRIASHGGQITLQRIEDNIVYVSMSGGCQGCGAAKLTLAHGVEGTIKRAVPQIKKVVDATDHAAGTQPYFAHTAP